MVLTQRICQDVYCLPLDSAKARNNLSQGYERVFDTISDYFPNEGNIKVLDLGCGPYGSDFVNWLSIFERIFVVYLDIRYNSLKELNRENSINSDGCQMPFVDGCFDLVYLGFPPRRNEGIAKGSLTYGMVSESRRVLKPSGVFMFTYKGDKPKETFSSLGEMSFTKVKRVLRVHMYKTSDIYVAL